MFIDDEKNDAVTARIEKLFRTLELDVLIDICRRLRLAKEITRSADYQFFRLAQLSAFKKNYVKLVRAILDVSEDELERLYQDVIASGYARDVEIYRSASEGLVPFEENTHLQQIVEACKRQSNDDLENITGTTGFVEADKGRVTPLSQFFVNILDKAHLEISTGAFTYDQAIGRAIRDMSLSGLRCIHSEIHGDSQWINYENEGKKPWSNRIDVAARRAVMTGIVQATNRIAEMNAETLGTNMFEVSAHATARPTHMVWQGKVYTKEELVSVCGLGEVTGLQGANCYHHYDIFIPGISKRRYTDEQLEEMQRAANRKKAWKGKENTLYEAKQRQLQLETLMRDANRRIEMYKASGLRDELAAEETRRNALYQEYRAFSRHFGLQEQINRVYYSKPDDLVRNASIEPEGTPPVLSSNKSDMGNPLKLENDVSSNAAFVELGDSYFGLPEGMKDLPKIEGNPGIKALIDVINPYGDKRNCVSCSTALALRLQGIDAISIPYSKSQLNIVKYPWKIWDLPNGPKCVIHSELKSSIENDMKVWGNGAICQITMVLDYGNDLIGHMITAFRHKGRTYYFDPQLKDLDVSRYFDHLMAVDPETNYPAGYFYYRVDGMELKDEGKNMVIFADDKF